MGKVNIPLDEFIRGLIIVFLIVLVAYLSLRIGQGDKRQ